MLKLHVYALDEPLIFQINLIRSAAKKNAASNLSPTWYTVNEMQVKVYDFVSLEFFLRSILTILKCITTFIVRSGYSPGGRFIYPDANPGLL